MNQLSNIQLPSLLSSSPWLLFVQVELTLTTSEESTQLRPSRTSSLSLRSEFNPVPNKYSPLQSQQNSQREAPYQTLFSYKKHHASHGNQELILRDAKSSSPGAKSLWQGAG